MSDLQTELNELKRFIADLKADRAAQKEKEQRESWTKYTTMSIALGSITLVTKKKPLWHLSLLLAGVAVAEMPYVWCS